MPSFVSQTGSSALSGKFDDVDAKVSVHDYLSSPKVVVFNQVRAVMYVPGVYQVRAVM